MKYLVLLMLGLSLISCEQTSFKSGVIDNSNDSTAGNNNGQNNSDPLKNANTGIGDPNDPNNNNLGDIGPSPLDNYFSGLSGNSKLTCEHQNITTNISGPRDSSSFSFSGELCPQAYQSMSIQIIVDQSGSMATADPFRISQLGCGRSSAVNAIVEKIKRTLENQNDTQTADVEIGLITFDSDARNEITHTGIDDFESKLDESSSFFGSKIDLCKANINDGELSGFTNYEAALNLARQNTLSAKFKKRVVVFITDGIASVSSTYTPSFVANEYDRIGYNGEGDFPTEVVDLFNLAHEDGKAAADELRNSFDEDFSMFALYLNGDRRDEEQLNAETKIAEIVDGERDEEYFLVEEANSLTEAALKIAFPAVPINTSTVSFNVTNSVNTENLSLSKPFSLTLADRYEFKTEAKKLLPGENIFQVEATDDRGNKHLGQITVNFEPTD